MSETVILATQQLSPETVLPGKSILLVDDDPIFRRISSAFFIAQGCSVVEAENGLDGLQKLRCENIDLVICDLSMPVLDGIEFAEEVCQSYPSLPIMVISATESMSDVAKVLKYGIKDFVVKPVQDYQSLALTVTNILQDSDNHLQDQRDFSSQWFHVEKGEIPEEEELHWHLNYLQNNPSAARDVLQALMPDTDTAQGDWRFSYRLLQSVELMPLVFDYAWLMEGQFLFYIMDSGSNPTDGIGSALLTRALFHDYVRNLHNSYADLKDLAEIIENGFTCATRVGPVAALFGLVDVVSSSLSVLPAGMDCQWRHDNRDVVIKGGIKLGNKCSHNFMTKGLVVKDTSQLSVNNLGVSSFTLDIIHHA